MFNDILQNPSIITINDTEYAKIDGNAYITEILHEVGGVYNGVIIDKSSAHSQYYHAIKQTGKKELFKSLIKAAPNILEYNCVIMPYRLYEHKSTKYYTAMLAAKITVNNDDCICIAINHSNLSKKKKILYEVHMFTMSDIKRFLQETRGDNCYNKIDGDLWSPKVRLINSIIENYDTDYLDKFIMNGNDSSRYANINCNQINNKNNIQEMKRLNRINEKTYRLTESQLTIVVNECVKKVLYEDNQSIYDQIKMRYKGK